ncbi:MAG: FliH/SctL family protein, partial [Steroidobacter sp.]
AHDQAVSSLETSVGEIAFAAVCRLLGSTAISPTLVLKVVDRMISQVRAVSIVAVRMHPRDIDDVTRAMRDRGPVMEATGLRIVPDESLELGGCVVETAGGQYDGSLDTQLRRLHAALTGNGLPAGEGEET